MTEHHIEIRKVADVKDMKAFIAVPWLIYREDPNWVPPLKIERKQAFSEKNPFFEHARWQAWLAYLDGVPVGRISAQIDSMYLERHDEHTGFFGLIEAIDDAAVFEALFAAAEQWLKEQGMKTALGPFSLGINQEVGCLIEGFDSPPYLMMGHARPYYDASIKGQGYGKAQDMLSYEMVRETFIMPERVQRLLQRLSQKIKVRRLDQSNKAAEFEIMRSIFNDAWSANWGFVPFTRKEFSTIAKELLMIVPDDFIHIAEVEGKPAAFVVLIPNLNEAIADLDGKLFPFGWARLLWPLKVRFRTTARIALLGVREEYQFTRLGPALAFSVIQALIEPSLQRGLKCLEMSWILEENQGIRNVIETVGGYVTKRYRMYEKLLL